MVLIIGASSLDNIIKQFPQRSKHFICQNTIAIRGLTFDTRSSRGRRAQLAITKSRSSEIILWHDCINNSESRHPTKPFRKPYSVQKLLYHLKKLKNKIIAIVYLQRNLSPNILEELQSTNILVIQVEKHILTKRTLENPEIASEVKKNSPCS